MQALNYIGSHMCIYITSTMSMQWKIWHWNHTNTPMMVWFTSNYSFIHIQAMTNYQWAHNKSTFVYPIHKQQSNVWDPLLDSILDLTHTHIYNNMHVFFTHKPTNIQRHFIKIVHVQNWKFYTCDACPKIYPQKNSLQ